jgi:hypothetical protein
LLKIILNIPRNGSPKGKIGVFALGLLFLSMLIVVVPVPRAAAQTQYVVASPGSINLGMNSTIMVTASASGTYTVIVRNPSGTLFKLNETFTAAGQTQNETFGNAASGFKGTVDLVGTYNVFVEQGTTLVSSTSFYATNQLVVSMTMVNGGTCSYVSAVTRGVKMFPRFLITYASNGVKVTNSDAGIYVTYTLPNLARANASWDPFALLFVGSVLPNWNYSNIGSWNPNATTGDAAGNIGTFQYTGGPFVISPATLSTSITLVNSKTNQTLSGLANGTSVTIYAVVTYPTNAEPVPGFVAPLDTATRGGTVTALVGWGYYNATSGTFGGGKTAGGQIAQVTLTYTGANGIWEGNLSSTSIPAIKAGTAYEVVVSSKDDANPPNTGIATMVLGPAAAQATTTSSSSSTTSSTETSLTTIPVWAYAGTTIALIIGVIVGFLARKPKSTR